MGYQEKVKEFQLISGQPVSDVPYTLTQEEYNFRDELYREEVKELVDAIVDNNRVEIMDALCDIKYVTDGTANEIGVDQDDLIYQIGYHSLSRSDTVNEIIDIFKQLPCTDVDEINHLVYYAASKFGFTLENFSKALQRVHESNMSKFMYDTKTIDRTKEFYQKQDIDTYLETKEKTTIIYRKGDGKVLKSIEYHPVILDDLV